MELITILNHCHRHRSFVYQHAHFAADRLSIEVDVRPRSGSAAIWSGCHQPAPGYDHLPQRRFEFIPLWGFLVFLLYRMRRVQCRNCGVLVEEVPWCDDKHRMIRSYMLFLAAGRVSSPGRRPPNRSTPRGTRCVTLSSMWWAGACSIAP